MIDGGAIERLRNKHLIGARIAHVAAVADDHRLLAAEKTELLAVLGARAGKKRREAIIIVLAVLLERMMVALGALDSHAQEKLSGRLGQHRSVLVDAVVIRRA